MRKRVITCQWFCDKIDTVPDFLDNVWFSDEVHFLLSGHVNSKNNIFWGSTSPEHCLQRPLHSVKCTAWVAISKHGVIGPFWFEDDNDPNVPAAPVSSFGAHFLSASETKSFCSTDLKLWRCLLHRLDLMQLTFCVNLNKVLEVIRFLVMTVFFVSPCICKIKAAKSIYVALEKCKTPAKTNLLDGGPSFKSKHRQPLAYF